jgi:hypothetical protein
LGRITSAPKGGQEAGTIAIGLVIGLEFDPDRHVFDELLASGAVQARGFQYVTARLSVEEASDRQYLKNCYMAACLDQNWPEGLEYADSLRFADLVVLGKSVVIVEPPGFDQPEVKPGGIIAGIGFVPTQADLDLLVREIQLQPGYEYVVKNYSEAEASSRAFLADTYLSVARQQAWGALRRPLSLQRRAIGGREFLLILPSDQEEPGDTAARPVAPSDKIIELFNRERIDPSVSQILAFALLYEREIPPGVWVDCVPEPGTTVSGSSEARLIRFLARKIVPGYQPHFIPAHLAVDKGTVVAGRLLGKGESLEVAYINRVLADMLADIAGDQDLNHYSALSLSGESTALGQTRFAILVGKR